MDLIVTKGDGIPLPDQKQAIEDFKKQASRSPGCYKPVWISIEDRWPEAKQGNKILAYWAGHVFECEYDDGFWCNLGGDDFTHWMPLPELPQASDLEKG